MYHAIITNLTTSPIMMASNIRTRPTRTAPLPPLPPMPTYPPPRLSSSSASSSIESSLSDDTTDSELDDDEEQLMQIECPSHHLLIEINKTPTSLNIIINGEYKYSIVLYPSLTFQDVYDSILISVPALNELKFKLKWHENMGEGIERASSIKVSSIKVSSIKVSSIRVSSKEFMKMPMDKLPVSSGEIVDKKIHKCILCTTESIHITQKCSACRKVYYCSASCQKLNWPYHRLTCNMNSVD